MSVIKDHTLDLDSLRYEPAFTLEIRILLGTASQADSELGVPSELRTLSKILHPFYYPGIDFLRIRDFTVNGQRVIHGIFPYHRFGLGTDTDLIRRRFEGYQNTDPFTDGQFILSDDFERRQPFVNHHSFNFIVAQVTRTVDNPRFEYRFAEVREAATNSYADRGNWYDSTNRLRLTIVYDESSSNESDATDSATS